MADECVSLTVCKCGCLAFKRFLFLSILHLRTLCLVVDEARQMKSQNSWFTSIFFADFPCFCVTFLSPRFGVPSARLSLGNLVWTADRLRSKLGDLRAAWVCPFVSRCNFRRRKHSSKLLMCVAERAFDNGNLSPNYPLSGRISPHDDVTNRDVWFNWRSSNGKCARSDSRIRLGISKKNKKIWSVFLSKLSSRFGVIDICWLFYPSLFRLCFSTLLCRESSIFLSEQACFLVERLLVILFPTKTHRRCDGQSLQPSS